MGPAAQGDRWGGKLMAKFKFKIHNGEIVRPTDQERIADALAEIKDGLSHIKDPSIWSGYPDGWSPGDEGDEDDRGKPVGLFLNLERCTRGNPTWQMAMAIETAFALGRISEGAKLTAAELKCLGAKAFAQNNAQKSAEARGSKAAAWHAVLEPLRQKHRAVSRSDPNWKSRRDLATFAADDIKEKLGRKVAPATIFEAIKEIEGAARQRGQAPRQRKWHAYTKGGPRAS
jgi:hypothetical protein